MLVGAGRLLLLLLLPLLDEPRTKGEPDEAVERVEGEAELLLSLLISSSLELGPFLASCKSLSLSMLIVPVLFLHFLLYLAASTL